MTKNEPPDLQNDRKLTSQTKSRPKTSEQRNGPVVGYARSALDTTDICFDIADIQTVQIGNCQIWWKIMKTASNRVHMAWFGPRIAQNRSHRLWGASGMPPGPPTPQKFKKITGFGGSGGQAPLFPLFSLCRQARVTLQRVVPWCSWCPWCPVRIR